MSKKVALIKKWLKKYIFRKFLRFIYFFVVQMSGMGILPSDQQRATP